MKGRNPIPGELKKLRGTDQPVRMYGEVEYDRITKVSVPRILQTTRARKIYKQRAQVLINMKLLQEPDQDLLVAYANALDLYYQAMEAMAGEDQGLMVYVITKSGTTQQINPYLKLQKELLDMVGKLAGHFGFSPSARAALKVGKPEEKKSEFEELMFGK